MKIRVSVLADYASISEGNKLNILGIFANVMSPSEPIVHPQMKVVTQYEFDPSESGEKKVKIVLVDVDGKEMFSINGTINVPHSSNNEPVIVNQILNLNNITFPRFGDYEFKILINNRLENTIPLKVMSTSSTKPTS